MGGQTAVGVGRVVCISVNHVRRKRFGAGCEMGWINEWGKCGGWQGRSHQESGDGRIWPAMKLLGLGRAKRTLKDEDGDGDGKDKSIVGKEKGKDLRSIRPGEYVTEAPTSDFGFILCARVAHDTGLQFTELQNMLQSKWVSLQCNR